MLNGWMAGAALMCAAAALWTSAGRAQERVQRLMDALVTAYLDFLARHEGNDIVWRDGTRMPFDDGKGERSFEARLEAG